jgi:phage head maturation protease
MRLYGELTKVEMQDDGTLKVFGVASSGSQDQVGETVLPEAVRAALPDYMAFAAVREMHQPSAAGTTLKAEVCEDGLTRIETQIVDPMAIRKVQAGVYKGFSLGGKTLARDPSDPSVITRIRLNEISLVDRPCNPDATIDLWKADLAEETPAPLVVQPSNEAVKAEADAMARAAGRPGRRNDYLAAARAALMKRAAPPDTQTEKALSKSTLPTEPDLQADNAQDEDSSANTAQDNQADAPDAGQGDTAHDGAGDRDGG